jgi:hypothetical protein
VRLPVCVYVCGPQTACVSYFSCRSCVCMCICMHVICIYIYTHRFIYIYIYAKCKCSCTKCLEFVCVLRMYVCTYMYMHITHSDSTKVLQCQQTLGMYVCACTHATVCISMLCIHDSELCAFISRECLLLECACISNTHYMHYYYYV